MTHADNCYRQNPKLTNIRSSMSIDQIPPQSKIVIFKWKKNNALLTTGGIQNHVILSLLCHGDLSKQQKVLVLACNFPLFQRITKWVLCAKSNQTVFVNWKLGRAHSFAYRLGLLWHHSIEFSLCNRLYGPFGLQSPKYFLCDLLQNKFVGPNSKLTFPQAPQLLKSPAPSVLRLCFYWPWCLQVGPPPPLPGQICFSSKTWLKAFSNRMFLTAQ